MGYISDTARNQTHNLFRPKREPIPLGQHSSHMLILLLTPQPVLYSEVSVYSNLHFCLLTDGSSGNYKLGERSFNAPILEPNYHSRICENKDIGRIVSALMAAISSIKKVSTVFQTHNFTLYAFLFCYWSSNLLLFIYLFISFENFWTILIKKNRKIKCNINSLYILSSFVHSFVRQY